MSVPAIFQTNVPAHLSTMSRETIAALNKDAAAGAGGNSIPRISLKQSRFRMVVGGEEVAVLPSFDLDVVVIHANPAASKTYYGKQWNGNDDREMPDCFSNDGIRPHTDAKTPQCASCAQCPHNAWGSKINPQTGAQGKACTDTKRIAVVAPGVLGTGDLFQLAIPPASLKEWAGFIGQLQQVNPPVPYFAIVTKISFDTKVSYPKLLFTPVRYLTEEEFALANERFSSAEAGAVAGLDNGPVAPQVTAPAAQSLGIPGTNPMQAAPAPQAAPAATGWGTPASQAAPVQQAAPAPQAAPAATGWGAPEQQEAPAAQEAPANPRRTRAAAAPVEQAAPAPQAAPATFDNEGTILPDQSVAIGGDEDLDSVFNNTGWGG